LIATASVVIGYVVYGAAQGEKQHDQQLAFARDVAELAPSKHELYVAWTYAFPLWNVSPFLPPARLREMWIVPLSIELRTPHVYGTMERFGIQDLYYALIAMPNVYLISNDGLNRLYAEYMREKYGVDVVFSKRFEGRTFTVYKPRLV
jgi:hypothetical protein